MNNNHINNNSDYSPVEAVRDTDSVENDKLAEAVRQAGINRKKRQKNNLIKVIASVASVAVLSVVAFFVFAIIGNVFTPSISAGDGGNSDTAETMSD